MTGLRGTVRPLAVLVVPVLIEQFLALAVGFVDKWLAGNLFAEAEPLAAIGLVAYCLAFLPVIFVLPVSAATALVARAVGAGDLRAARRAAGQCLLVTGLLAIGSMLLAMLGGERFIGWLGLPGGSPPSRTLLPAWCGSWPSSSHPWPS